MQKEGKKGVQKKLEVGEYLYLKIFRGVATAVTHGTLIVV